MPSYIITVDPGFGGTGWAVIPCEGLTADTLHQPEETGCIQVTKPKDWTLRGKIICEEFAKVLHKYGKYNTVYIEMPKYMQGNASATTDNSGAGGDGASAIFKLQFLVGALSHTAWSCGCHFRAVPVGWKGQLSKEAVICRIYKRLGNDIKYPNHVADAVGLYLFVMGRLNESKSFEFDKDLASPFFKDIPSGEDGVGMEGVSPLSVRKWNAKESPVGRVASEKGTQNSLERKGIRPGPRVRKRSSS